MASLSESESDAYTPGKSRPAGVFPSRRAVMYMFNGSRCVGPCRSSRNGLDNTLEKLDVLMHFLHLDILSGKGVDLENLSLTASGRKPS